MPVKWSVKQWLVWSWYAIPWFQITWSISSYVYWPFVSSSLKCLCLLPIFWFDLLVVNLCEFCVCMYMCVSVCVYQHIHIYIFLMLITCQLCICEYIHPVYNLSSLPLHIYDKVLNFNIVSSIILSYFIDSVFHILFKISLPTPSYNIYSFMFPLKSFSILFWHTGP